MKFKNLKVKRLLHLVKFQDISAQWTEIPIRSIKKPQETHGSQQDRPIDPTAGVLMDDYLIILAFDCEFRNSEGKLMKRYPRLLAVDLRDLSAQQVRIDNWVEKCSSCPKFHLQKYHENQIIVFDISEGYRCSHLTIESFLRKQS